MRVVVGKVCNTVQVAQALSHVEWISQGLETSKPRNMKASNAEALLYHHTIADGTRELELQVGHTMVAEDYDISR